MRILALDIGDKRTGVAISDPSGRIATPLTVLETSQQTRADSELARIVGEYDVESIVVGLPRSLDGELGPQARHVQALAAKMARFLRVPIEYTDERLSSAEAVRRMREAGESERSMRGRVDMVAASVFLQTYLDERAAPGSEGYQR